MFTDHDALFVQHGTDNRYSKKGCRCASCRDAHARQARRWRARNAARGLHALDPRHGTRYAFLNLGCRCDRCRAASVAYDKNRSAAR